MVEKKGRKAFSKGLWAPTVNIETARVALEAERSTDSYAKKRSTDLVRRAREQSRYVTTFEEQVLAFLNFSETFQELAQAVAAAVTKHATPVGSGTVARTKRIPVQQRAEAAVIAWMRHQTTAYDNMHIARVKGKRREVRRELAMISRAVLDLHRGRALHNDALCPLCVQRLPPEEP